MTDTATRTFDLTASAAPAAPPVVEAAAPSLLDAVRRAVTARQPRKPLTLKVPASPEGTVLAVRCSADIQPSDLERWREWSRPDPASDADATTLAAHVLINTCRAVLVNGVDVKDDAGAPLTFKSAELQRQVGAMDAPTCVRAFFGNDWHMIDAGNKVLDASGWQESVEQLDPTQRS